MPETVISPLRQRMIDDMTVRHFVEKTRTAYIRQVRRFAAFLGRSPETASPEDVRQFQVHLTESGVTPPSRNAAVAALRFFFTAKRPFAGPKAVLAYLARYTHRVALSNSRLIRADDSGITFTWKDYRVEGRARGKTMTLAVNEFIRRFLLHVLPRGFHRIRHYGLFAHGGRATNLTRARALLGAREPPCETATAGPAGATAPSCLQPCPCCGGRMIIIERFVRVFASTPTAGPDCCDPDRHLMNPMALTRCRPVARHHGWSCAGRAGARSNGAYNPRMEHQWAPSRQLGHGDDAPLRRIDAATALAWVHRRGSRTRSEAPKSP